MTSLHNHDSPTPFQRLSSLWVFRLKGLGRRFVTHAIDHVVILLCASILLGLYILVFKNFLDRIPGFEERISNAWNSILFLGMSFFLGYFIREAFDTQNGWSSFAKKMGASPQEVTLIRGSSWGISIVSLTIFYCVTDVSLLGYISGLGLMTLLLFFPHFIQTTSRINFQPHILSRSSALMWWGLRKASLMGALKGWALIWVALWVGIALTPTSSPLYFWALVFLFSIVATVMLSLLLSKCVSTGFQERQTDITHHDIWQLCMRLTIGWGLLQVVGLGLMMGFLSNKGGEWIKLSMVPLCFLVFVPATLFQVDARKPIFTIAISALGGIFLSTLFHVSWWSLFALPFVAHYGKTSQEGRYYRT